MPAPDPTRIHIAYRSRLDRIRALAVAQTLVAEDPAAAVPVVLAAQRSAIAAADAYLSLEAGLATGTTTDPWGINPEPLIGRAARGGTFLEDVYGRNWSVSESTFTERITREVNTDVTLAERSATWVHTEGDPRITGYRRIPSATACDLCIAASGRTYKSGVLRPIHAHCGCTTQPIYGNGPAPVVTDRFLTGLYDQPKPTLTGPVKVDPDALPAGVDASALPAVAVATSAELGPLLVAA